MHSNSLYHRHRFPAEIISHSVWLYYRFALLRYAKEIGLDLEQFDREMSSRSYADQIMKDYYNSLVHGITGTPTTFINGELYAMSGVELLAAVERG
jgi:protein-disulfide isomerase